MDNAIIFDIAAAAVLLLGTIIGATRGLIKSVIGLVAVVAALLGAAFVANLVSEPVTELIWPKIEEKLVERFTEDFEQSVRAEPADTERGLTRETLDEFLERYGIPEESRFRIVMEQMVSSIAHIGDSVKEDAVEAYRDTLSSSVKALVGTVMHAAIFCASFLVLLILLKLAAGVLDKVAELPVLHTLNGLGGAVFGLTETVLLAFLALWLARRFGAGDWLDAHAEGTYLYSFFLNNTPKTLISILLNGR